MKRILDRLPSPAMVVACLALAVALGGTGYAGIKLPAKSVGTKQLRHNAVISSKVKDGSLLVKDFKRGQVPVGPKGDKGDPGAPGTPGAPGAPGTALYYAYIGRTGTVDLAHSKGVVQANVAHTGTGRYCITGLNPAPKNAVANLGYDGAGYDMIVGLGDGNGGCPVGSQLTLTAYSNAPAPADTDFFIVMN